MRWNPFSRSSQRDTQSGGPAQGSWGENARGGVVHSPWVSSNAFAAPGPELTAAVEAAAGLIARSLAMAEVTPVNIRTSLVTPEFLMLTARELIRRGQALYKLELQAGGGAGGGGNVNVLTPSLEAVICAYWEVRGGARPPSWWFRADIPGPDLTETLTFDSAEALFFRYSYDPKRPWIGRGPMDHALLTAQALGGSERLLANEANSPSGHALLYQGEVGTPEGTSQTRNKIEKIIGKLKGGLATTVYGTPATWGDQTMSPVTPKNMEHLRLGYSPEAAMVSMRDSLMKSTFTACGVPLALFSTSDGTAAREAWRQFLHSTIAPLAAIVLKECRAKLETPELKFDFAELRASDIVGRARAFKSLVEGGKPLEEASRITGILSDES